MNTIPSGLNGPGNDHIAINAAILANRTILLEGEYHVSGEILVPYTASYLGKRIVSNGAVIYGDAANSTILHWAESYGAILGNLALVANNQGVHLMHLTPEQDASNTTVANQNYNYFQSLTFVGGDEQLMLMAGREIGSTASGCWYNRFDSLRFTSGRRAILFRDNGSTSIVSSGSNSNSFGHVVINGSCNTGVQIDAGGGNRFHDISFENVALGNYPSTTPTGIAVADNMVNGGDNPDNEFHAHFENVTRHAYINEQRTRLIGSAVDWSLVQGEAKNLITGDTAIRGTWAPTLSCDSGSFSVDYQDCAWIKRGKIVTITGYVRVSAVNGASGRAYLNGLPFPAAPGLGNRTAIGMWANLLATTGVPVMGRLMEGSSTIELAKSGSVGGFAQEVPQYSDFTINATYMTDR